MQYSEAEKDFLVAGTSLPGVGPVSLRKVLFFCRESATDVCEVCRFTADQLRESAGVGAEAAGALALHESLLESGSRLRERFFNGGVKVIFDDSELYPGSVRACLGPEAPPVLFVAGHAELLAGKCAGIVGSRQPSPSAAEAARACSAGLAERGWTVVSGAAAGIDTCGHLGALAAGGATVILPPEGIMSFRWDSETADLLDGANWCLASYFPPLAGWETRYALMRNKMITALSTGVFAFEPRDTGGTWHSSNMALEMCKPLFVVSFKQDRRHRAGLEKLVRRGAVALNPRRMPPAGELERMLLEYEAPPGKFQNMLFGADGET